MGSLIDRTGTFRGVVLDSGVSLTKNDFPQFNAKLQGLELWDEESETWVDWSSYEENEITAYLVLYGRNDKATLSCKQIKKVFGWSGESFEELNDADYSELKIQFRVVDNTYEGKTTKQVEWIDEYDAIPGRTVKKCTPDELKSLDAKYKSFLNKKAPAKAPAQAKPTTPKKALDTKTTPPKTVKTTPQATLPEGKCTKEEAWEAVTGLQDKSVTDKQLSIAWQNAVLKVMKRTGKTEEDLTVEDWHTVKGLVLEETAVF